MINNREEFCPAVIVMAKTPRPGTVKTRLHPLLSEAQSAALASCFFQDTIASASRVTPNIIVAFAPADGRKELENLVSQQNLLWFEQPAGDLGTKIESALNYAKRLGFTLLITIGADSPTLPPDYIKKAFEVLASRTAEIVLGPTQDGGFYLLGLNNIIPRLFNNIAWSTSTVYQQTIENAANLGFSKLFELPVWYDIDTPPDLLFLRDEILSKKELQISAPATYRWMLEQQF